MYCRAGHCHNHIYSQRPRTWFVRYRGNCLAESATTLDSFGIFFPLTLVLTLTLRNRRCVLYPHPELTMFLGTSCPNDATLDVLLGAQARTVAQQRGRQGRQSQRAEVRVLNVRVFCPQFFGGHTMGHRPKRTHRLTEAFVLRSIGNSTLRSLGTSLTADDMPADPTPPPSSPHPNFLSADTILTTHLCRGLSLAWPLGHPWPYSRKEGITAMRQQLTALDDTG